MEKIEQTYKFNKFKYIFTKFIQTLFILESNREAYKLVNKLYYHLINKYKEYYYTHPDYFYQLNYYVSVYNDSVNL